jgi:hypothetical protein
MDIHNSTLNRKKLQVSGTGVQVLQSRHMHISTSGQTHHIVSSFGSCPYHLCDEMVVHTPLPINFPFAQQSVVLRMIHWSLIGTPSIIVVEDPS